MSTNLTFEDVLREVLDARLADVHTALPAKVVNYDAAKQTADLQPLVKDAYYDSAGALKTRSFPVLPSVPVAFFRAGGFFVSAPLVAGDTGMLIFSELPIDRWRSTGQEAHPLNARRHGVTGGVFYPGVGPRARALAEDGVDDHMVLGKEGGAQVHVSADQVNLYEQSAVSFVSLATKVDQIIALIDGVFRATTTPTPGGGAALKAAWLLAFPSAPSSTAAAKVKAT